MSGRIHRSRRARQAGFTLLELMVAMTIGALVVAAMFSIGGASSRHFQEQQRIGVTQRSVRHAMNRIRHDLARAGYLHVAHERAPGVNTCPAPPLTRSVPAVWFDDADPVGESALDTVNRSANGVSADRLRLIGNYATGDDYLTSSIDSNGRNLFLQTDWLAFRRSFLVNGAGGPVLDRDRFEDVVFKPGSMVRVHVPETGREFFLDVTGSSLDASGTARIELGQALPLGSECFTGLGRGTLVTPLSWIEYAIIAAPADSTLASNAAAVTGPNTLLVRRELDMSDPSGNTIVRGTQRVILEYAVNFDLNFVVDTNLVPGGVPTISIESGASAENLVQTTPWMVRGAVVSLAARTPEQDTRFPWPDSWSAGRPPGAPLNRYRVFNDRDGAARVRSLVTEVQMPNLIP